MQSMILRSGPTRGTTYHAKHIIIDVMNLVNFVDTRRMLCFVPPREDVGDLQEDRVHIYHSTSMRFST